MTEFLDKYIDAKLVFVGSGSVGKTSLANRLLQQPFEVDSHITHGIDIRNWKISNDDIGQINLNIWDFGGQEIYYQTHQLFLTKHSIYVLVWTARNDQSLHDFSYWLDIISLLGENSPILIVMNKADVRTRQIDENGLKEKFPSIAGFYSTSAKTSFGIQELRSAIVECAIKLGYDQQAIPLGWIDLKRKLDSFHEDYITREVFNDLCTQYGLGQKSIQLVGKYFHDLGSILFFDDDPVLKGILVINPNWITGVIYTLFDAEIVYLQRGLLKRSDTHEIWQEYDDELFEFFLRLIQRFEIAFQLDDDNFIFPQLLPPDKPKIEWGKKDSLQFVYQYDFMPFGIISRFIVRAFELIKQNLFWKNGVYLQYKHNEALIESNWLTRSVELNIIGPNKSEFLALLRHQFDQINDSFNNLRVNNLVPCKCSKCSNSDQPFLFNYNALRRFQERGKLNVDCLNSFESIPIEHLLNPVSKPVEEIGVQELQPEEHQRLVYEWDQVNNLNFEYHFHLPKKEILRLFEDRLSKDIIKIGSSSKGLLLLEREENKALIKNDIVGNKITISVNGIDNLELLSILRYEFENIYPVVEEETSEAANAFNEYICCICNECLNAPSPHYFDFNFLRKRKSKGKSSVACPISADDVTLNSLFGQNVNRSGDHENETKTIFEQIIINNSDEVNLSGVSKKKEMKIKKVVNKGGQNVFSDRIENSNIVFNRADTDLLEIFDKYASNKEERNELEKALIELKSDTEAEKKKSARDRIEEFLHQHSTPIGQSVVGALLLELGKYIFI